MVGGPLPKTLNTCGLLLIKGFAISRQRYLVKASARGPRKTAPFSPRGAEGSG